MLPQDRPQYCHAHPRDPSTPPPATPRTPQDNTSQFATPPQVRPPYGPPYHHAFPILYAHFASSGAFTLLPQPLAPISGPGGVVSHAPQLWRRRRPPLRKPVNPRSIPSNHPRNCHNRAAGRDPGVTGIPYRGLGLIPLVGTTHDTSLLYVATQGKRVKNPSLTLMYGGSTAHHEAGTTCHTALAVIRPLPSPHTHAMRTLPPPPLRPA